MDPELGFTEAVRTGRLFIIDGTLDELREWFSLSYTRLATHLHTNSRTLKRWMADPDFAARMHDTTAARIGQFSRDLGWWAENLLHGGVKVTDLYPLSLLAGQLGRSISSPSFTEACQTGRITCYDLDVLGIYIPKAQIEALKGPR